MYIPLSTRTHITDGGRAEAGYKGVTGDCMIRALAIATERPYKEVYKDVFAYMKAHPTMWQRADPKRCSPRYGVPVETAKAYLAERGWAFIPREELVSVRGVDNVDRLPLGTILVLLPRHIFTMRNGVAFDVFEPKRLKLADRLVSGIFMKNA